ncbi:guanine nucleotide-binding protein subunit gamma 1-like [Pyrus ussuriensis x Pyrus communis]|uniref:Guanine nucleotide-binding protein subunit gamma 1-like n=1 Tax=Pyrus ussuriensis x Pyrus communis TaxID=2448454 RepID=A0A5N5GZ49_9ROSA|nr:guanine nucleotide-binding protein subunit gamma 1-like [Pyrus ussuriensis x Pyrus communis]
MDNQVEEENPASSPATGRGDGRGGGGGGGGVALLPLHFEDRARAGQFPAFIGKHKLAASISHLEKQIDIIQKELDHLETVGESSIVCKDLIATVESTSDPLLPWTKGPGEVGWDRWFRGAHNSKNQSRWI